MNKNHRIHSILHDMSDLIKQYLVLVQKYIDNYGHDDLSREAIKDIESKKELIARTLKKGGEDNDLQKSKEWLKIEQWAKRIDQSPLTRLMLRILKLF